MIAFGINSAVPGSEIKVLHELLVHPWRWVALLVLAIELILAALGIVGLQIFEQTDSVRYLMISVMMGSALFSLLCVVHVIVWPKYPTPQVLGGVFAGRLATTASGFCAITFLLIDGMHGEARMATYFNSFNCFYFLNTFAVVLYVLPRISADTRFSTLRGLSFADTCLVLSLCLEVSCGAVILETQFENWRAIFPSLIILIATLCALAICRIEFIRTPQFIILMVLRVLSLGASAGNFFLPNTIKAASVTDFFVIANSVWLYLRLKYHGVRSDEEIGKLLPHEDKNAIQIPELLAEASRANWAINPADISLVRKIGAGGFGEVWLGRWRGTVAAIKRMHSVVSSDSLTEFCREASILSVLRHPNVISLYGASAQLDNLMLVVEYAPNGSVYDYLRSSAELSFVQRIKMALDAARGMSYLHSQTPMVIHRDLKSPNLLVMSDLTVKVSDFGTSKWIQNTVSMTANVGSAVWSAPEVLRYSSYSEKADIYSFAIILWELVTREPDVYPGMLGYQIAIEVGTNGRRPPLPSSEQCPDPAIVQLMQRCWVDDPHARPPFSAIAQMLEAIVSSHESK